MTLGLEKSAAAPLDAPKEGFGRGLRTRFTFSPGVLILCALVLAVMIPPILYLVRSSLYTTNPDGSFDQLTFRFYTELATNPRFFNNFMNTVIYAVGAAMVALVIGTVQAWIVERTNTPLRKYVFLISIMSLGIPSVLYTIAFILLLGKSGPINQFLTGILGMEEGLRLYTLWGMMAVEGLDFAPLVFLLLSSVFRAVDASLEEASFMSGGGIRQTFARVTLRLALPGILALLILIFIRAFESFETPALIGRPGGIYVLTTDIFRAARTETPPNFGQAGAYSVILLSVAIILLFWYNRISRHAERYQTIIGKGFRPRVTDLGRWRYLTAAILVVLFVIIIVLPIGMVVWASLLPYYQGLSFRALQFLTLDNFRFILDSDKLSRSIANTMILGVATATTVSLFTAMCAWFVVRRYRGAWLLDQLVTAPLVFPSIVLGVALLQVYLNVPFALYGTLLALIIAGTIRYLPYGMRYSYAGILQIHTELEEASYLSGARQYQTFFRVVVPLVAPALVTSWLFVFLSVTKVVSLMILLMGPDTPIVAVLIFDLWEDGSLPELAALGVAWTAFMTVVAVLFYLVSRRYGFTNA